MAFSLQLTTYLLEAFASLVEVVTFEETPSRCNGQVVYAKIDSHDGRILFVRFYFCVFVFFFQSKMEIEWFSFFVTMFFYGRLFDRPVAVEVFILVFILFLWQYEFSVDPAFYG